MPLRPAVFDRHILAFDKTSLSQSLAKRQQTGGVQIGRIAAKKPDHRQRRLLRARRERPRGRAADEGDERAAFPSTTSPARAMSVAGTSRPSAFAVLRLMARTYLVGNWTGKSAGFSPLRTRSM